MKRLFTALLLFWMFCNIQAQTDTSEIYSRGSHHILLSVDFEMNSNSLTNEFIRDFYYGEYLTRELREKISARLNNKNLGGYCLDGKLYYLFSPDSGSRKIGYFIGIEQHSMAELRFNKDLFDLIFFGNEMFTDKYAFLDGSKLNMMDWQQFKVGVYKSLYGKRGRHDLGVGLAVNKGQRHIFADVHHGSFFTQKDAEYVALYADYDFRRTDTANSGIWAFNGYGASADVLYDFTAEKKYDFKLRLSNIGYIRWDKSPDNFRRDTIYNFEGFNITLGDNLSNTFIDSTTLDSIADAVFGSSRREPYSVMLPLEVQFLYTHYFLKGRLSFTFHFKHRFFTLYKPCFILKPCYQWNFRKSSLGIAPVVSYGGYGKFNAGLNLKSSLGKHVILEAGTGTLNSLLWQKNTAGLNVNFSLFTKF